MGLNQGWSYREQVRQADAGLTVLDYYTRRYAHSGRDEWQERIVSGQILVDGHPAVITTIVQPGQWLTYQRSPWEEPDVPLTFDKLYEDSDLVVVAKPAGLPVLPGGGFLEHTLLRQIQRCYPQEAPVPIHRLGRGTSGLVLLARSPLAKSHLTQQMRQRQIYKSYRALATGIDMPEQFTLTQAIGKIPHPVLGYIYGATQDGMAAQSECQVVKRHDTTTLLDVVILTGRPHQIRIHLAAAGYPLVGDPLYLAGGIPRQGAIAAEASSPSVSGQHGNQVHDQVPVPGDCGYHLHAHQLSFMHPRSQEPVEISCRPPKALE